MRSRGVEATMAAIALAVLGLLCWTPPVMANPGFRWDFKDAPGNFFRLDEKDFKWREYQGGKVKYVFEVAARSADTVTIADRSRAVTVELGPTEAIVKQGGVEQFRIAGWWHRAHWSHSNGEFVLRKGSWVEYQKGKAIASFVETSRGLEEVTLFDKSRGITVRLRATVAEVFQGGTHTWDYGGGWHN